MPHRRVVGGTLDESVPSSRSMRTKGYLSAFAERGVTPDLNLIRECGEWTSAEGAQAYVRCMRRAFDRMAFLR